MIIKWLNEHPEWRDRAFWTSAVSIISLFAIKIAGLLGYQIEEVVGQYQEQILYLIGLAIAILGVFLPPPQKDENNDLNQSQ